MWGGEKEREEEDGGERKEMRVGEILTDLFMTLISLFFCRTNLYKIPCKTVSVRGSGQKRN